MGRAGRAREIRLPGLEDADRPQRGGASRWRGAALRSICRKIPLDDARTYRMLGRGETVGVFQVESARHAQGARRNARRPVRGPDRARRALSAGPDGQHSRSIARASSAEEKVEYTHPKLEPILKETFGVIIYQEQVMQIAQDLAGYSPRRRPTSCAARWARRSRRRWTRSASRFVAGAVERGRRQDDRRRHLRRLREIRGLRLQQIPFGGLRAAHLSDRLFQGQSSGRIPRRLDDAG